MGPEIVARPMASVKEKDMRRIVSPLIPIFIIIVTSLGFSGVASAQDDPAAPCGAAGQLSSEFSGNVAVDSRCFELRMYTAEPARNGKGGD